MRIFHASGKHEKRAFLKLGKPRELSRGFHKRAPLENRSQAVLRRRLRHQQVPRAVLAVVPRGVPGIQSPGEVFQLRSSQPIYAVLLGLFVHTVFLNSVSFAHRYSVVVGRALQRRTVSDASLEDILYLL